MSAPFVGGIPQAQMPEPRFSYVGTQDPAELAPMLRGVEIALSDYDANSLVARLIGDAATAMHNLLRKRETDDRMWRQCQDQNALYVSKLTELLEVNKKLAAENERLSTNEVETTAQSLREAYKAACDDASAARAELLKVQEALAFGGVADELCRVREQLLAAQNTISELRSRLADAHGGG